MMSVIYVMRSTHQIASMTAIGTKALPAPRQIDAIAWARSATRTLSKAPAMEHFPISVTLLANAGVCIGYRGMTLLLDGIFGREGNPFSPLPADCRQKMCRGEPPFEKLDCLLFTHFHPDHFSPEMTMQIVGSRPVRALFFPEDEAEPVQELAYFLRRRDIPFVQLSHTTDHTVWRLGEHIRLQAGRSTWGRSFMRYPMCATGFPLTGGRCCSRRTRTICTRHSHR